MDFAEYVAAHRPTLVRSAVLLGCGVDDAEDLVQTALARCLRSWRRVSATDRPDAYVYTVLVNSFRDSRARRWTGELPAADLPEPSVAEAELETGLGVRRALAPMTPEHREVLVLRFYADLSERDTAAALKVPTGTVKSRTARALKALATDQNIVRTPDAL